MPLVLKHTYELLIYALPDASNLILVLLGVVMSLPNLAERVEENTFTRIGLALSCLLFGLAGFTVSLHQRRQSDLQQVQLVGNVNLLVTSTNALVGNTNTVLTTFGVLMPQVTALKGEVADVNGKLELAREKHAPREIAELEAKADAAQRLVDTASSTLSVALLPRITQQMRDTTLALSSGEKQQQVKGEKVRQSQLRARYEAEMRPLIFAASLLQQQVLQGRATSQEDKAEAAIFIAALNGDFTSFDGIRETAYLDRLLIPAPP